MEFKMPDIGEGVAEGEVVKWLVKEGDSVVEDQPIVELQTDKATVVIPSPAAGVVEKIYVQEGTTARVGSSLVSIVEQGAPAKPASERIEATPGTASAPQPPPSPPPAPRPDPSAERSRDTSRKDNGRPLTGQTSRPPGRVMAAPATRKMAREAGVDLSRVPASGPHGRVTRDDLDAYLERGQEPAEKAPARPTDATTEATGQARREPVGPGVVDSPTRPVAPAAPRFPEGPRPEDRVPMRGVRKKISENMRASKDHAAHFTFVEECDMTELVKLREDAETLARKHDVRLTYLPFIVKAVVAGLKEFPYLNSVYDEESQEIVLKGYYNIGIAAATDEGLTVPVVKGCDRKSILEIARDIQQLSDAARARRLRLEDLQGGTFTITSLGPIGGIMATPIINYPEVAILGVHKIRKRPVVKDDEIVIRHMCYLTCSFDHRIIDGHVGAQFVLRVVSLLEDPRLLMLGA